jgi:hypothetical protein
MFLEFHVSNLRENLGISAQIKVAFDHFMHCGDGKCYISKSRKRFEIVLGLIKPKRRLMLWTLAHEVYHVAQALDSTLPQTEKAAELYAKAYVGRFYGN